MKVVGLITEYNPFHKGHQYHIEQALRLTGADAALVVMSGNYVQRGAPALLPKHLRAEAALRGGASVVIELPVCYAVGSAEYFAYGAVSLLTQLGCVDSICFGAETTDLPALEAIAQVLTEEPPAYRQLLQAALRSGLSFPQARQQALSAYFDDTTLSSFLEQPNHILGIEYLKALRRLNSSIRPYVLQRTGAGYHDLSVEHHYSSASAIRNLIAQDSVKPPELLGSLLPSESCRLCTDNWNTRFPVFSNDYSLLLKYRLLTMQPEDLAAYADVTKDLANRIWKLKTQYQSFDQFCELLKTRQFTYTRISRALLHILLDIKTEDLKQYVACGSHGYARLLGFRQEHTDLLSQLKKNSKIPLITKLATAKQIQEPFSTMLAHDIFASDLYESVLTEKYHTPFRNEYEQQIVRI